MKRFAIAALIVLPAVAAALYVHLYGVDVPYWDEWEFVRYYQLFYEHQLKLADLFALHNEHRIFFPRLVMLALGNAFDGNVVSWMYASVLLLAASAAVLFAQHRKLHAPLTFAPAAWLIFSLRQGENLLWGWQVCIPLCVAGLLAACVLLLEGGFGRLLLAAGFAFVSSFSFGAGLLAWPALFALLLCRRRLERIPWSMPLTWLVLWAGCWVLYLHRDARVAAPPQAVHFGQHPGGILYGVLVALGGCLSSEVRSAAAAAGLMLLLLAVIAFAAARGALDWKQALPAVPLILFAGSSAAMIGYGRTGIGETGFAIASRYASLTILGAVGLYLAALAVTAPVLRQTALSLFAAIFLLSIFASLDGTFAAGRRWRELRLRDAAILRDLTHRRDKELSAMSYDPQFVRERAAVLARYKLSVFSE